MDCLTAMIISFIIIGSICIFSQGLLPRYLTVHDSQGLWVRISHDSQGLCARIPHCAWLPGSLGQDTSLSMTPRVSGPGYLTVHDSQGLWVRISHDSQGLCARTPHCAWLPGSLGQDTSLSMTARVSCQDTPLSITPRVSGPGYLTVHDSQGLWARIPHCPWLPGSLGQDTSLSMTARVSQDTSLCITPRVSGPGYLTVHDSQGLWAKIPHCAWLPGSLGQDKPWLPGSPAKIPHCPWLPGSLGQDKPWLPGSVCQDTSLSMTPRVCGPGYLTAHDSCT